ncbi:acetyl-CoA synthetase-like protein [Phanerochaete sordida]|uniref:Acetyl-CoA synthetase-like protein n=1 Tax=Phanerochaete sordida TaxID=48140 RepID=A0A9P3GQ97_9APHY|nr:acetyl-CoA synthetase-like protein [Phanerochaete sordida]
MSKQPVLPPLDGSISVLPGLVDFNERQNPDLPWAILAPESGTDVVSISFAEYAKATHRVARILRPDGSSANGEVIAVLAHCDSLLYLALLAGLVRAGYVPFPISPKNSVPAIISMFDKVACGRIISQSSFQHVLAAVEAHFDERGRYLHVVDIPALDQVFPVIGGPSPAVEPFPSSVDRTFSPENPLFYLHSSGSTGFPKPIPLRQVQALQWCRSPVLFDARDHGIRWGSMPLPPYHTIGIYMQLFAPIMSGHPVSLYKPQYPAAPPVPTPLNVIRAARVTGATGIAIVPAFLESWAHSEESMEFLKTLDILVYAGGPLSPAIGDQLVSAGVKVYSVYGGTEFGVHTKIFDMDDSQGPDADVKTSKDWEWVRFPDWMTCRWEPQGDGQFELQCLTRPEHRPSVENLSDVTGYATHDLLVPHPTKKGLWKLVGRKDDVIVLSIGRHAAKPIVAC